MRPFLLAQKNQYAALKKIKFLETFVYRLTQKLISSALPWQQEVLKQLNQVMRGFDQAQEEEKKRKIERAISLIHYLIHPWPQWNILATPLEHIPMLTPRWRKIFKKKGITNLEELLYFLPTHYEDHRHFKYIKDVQVNQTVVIQGNIIASGILPVKRGKKKLYKVAISDGTGEIAGVWFNYQLKYMQAEFKPGRRVTFSGLVHQYGWEKVIYHPEVSWGSETKLEIVPVYPEINGIYPKQTRNLMHRIVLKYVHFLGCPFPTSLRQKYQLLPLWEAAFYLHLPPVDASLQGLNQKCSPYHYTLKFMEFFWLELGLALKREAYSKKKGISLRPSYLYIRPFLKDLPFTLTNAQKRVFEEIKENMASSRPMHRLLQGDVGSGKTIIALLAALIAIESGYQVAIMAPTEILAEQHLETAQRFLKDLPIKWALLTSKLRSGEKQAIYRGITEGKYQLVIGTHALIQEGVVFHRLGLVIIDEQHRFGVAQRATLVSKGRTPDVLVITATPIPRTLSMTLYGDLDISILDELPPGRKPIKTIHFWERDRQRVYQFLEEKLKEGNQVYIVYPLIEDSEVLELKAATTMYEKLKKHFSQYKVALLHGRMKAAEKKEIMNLFRTGDIEILVATTVIEVGIDVPQASVMVIEHAERFGLAQLHQLRGRVGRGAEQAYCLLLTPEKITSLARQRLKVIVETNDGFKIAEADLGLRGPGEILGTKQAGFPELRFADMIKDIEVLKKAREAAFHIIARDPKLKSPEYKYLLSYLRHFWGKRIKLGMVG